MGYRYYDYEEKRLQRKLIPLNIFVAIICLVAAISLMFTPFIQVDLGKAVEAASQMEQDGSPANPDEGTGTEVSGEDAATEAVMGSLKGKIGVTPIVLGKIAFAADDAKATTLVKSMLFDNGVFDEMMTSMANAMLVSTIAENVPEGVDYETLQTALEKIDSVKSKDEFDTAVDDYVKVLETQTNSTFDDDLKETIAEYRDELWNETVAATGGDFSIESMVCVFTSKSMGEDAPVVTTYEELFDGMLDGSINIPGSGEGENGIAEAMKQADELLGAMMDYLGYVFYAFCGFAGIWVILFLFSFFHMFAKNKRFTMWYVKIFGGIPCLIFGVVFKVLGIPAVATALMGAEAATMLPMLGAISSLTWISGGCYLALWLVSIFWAFPIKRKIRRLRR